MATAQQNPRENNHNTAETTTTGNTSIIRSGKIRRTEPVYVLFASQTGNSEHWAKELSAQLPQRLSPASLQRLISTTTTTKTTAKTITSDDDDDEEEEEEIIIEPRTMSMDDFLEVDKCAWSRLMVIVTSSYGIGQAPLGGYRFRELCDYWYKDNQDKDDVANAAAAARPPSSSLSSTSSLSSSLLLEGVSYAMCGLGDSKYTTYFRNPTRIDEALQYMGAKRVGPLGKADASGVGDESQSKVVEEWMAGIWPHLAQVVVQPPLSKERLKAMQQSTIQVCQRINPDFEYDDPTTTTRKNAVTVPRWMELYSVAVVAALLAIGYYHYYYQSTWDWNSCTK